MAQESHKEEGRKENEEALSALLRPYRAFITYAALRSEVPFRDYVELPLGATEYQIAPRASLDSHTEAEAAVAAADAGPCVILIPGRAFDAHGTRHGRGGGWYDRFLAEVPEEWLRVGFCFDTQFSKTPLSREAWDQPVDAIAVISAQGVALHDTKARA